MVERAGLEFGRLDIAFNNAGIGSAGKFVADESEEDFDRVMDGGFVIQRVRSGAELAMSVGSADAMKVFSLIGSTRKLPGRVTGNRRRVADDSLGTKRKRRRTIGGSIVFTRDNPSFSVKPEMHSLPDVRPPLR